VSGQITYYTFDLMTSTLLAELPFAGVSFSSLLNSAGSFSGTLNLADSRIQALNPIQGTRPARTLLIVDVDGVIEWAGIVWARPGYDSSQRILAVNGEEAWSYFSRRVQPKDYPTLSGSAESIANTLITDALATPGSAFGSMTVNLIETQTNGNPLTETFPIAQRQTIETLVTTLSSCGYLTGFDFGIDWQWSAGQGSTPVPTMTINYPRRGRIAGTTGLIIDSATCLKYSWGEDGKTAANTMYGTASHSGVPPVVAADPSPISAGYPLLEAVKSYTHVDKPDSLASAIQGDLSLIEWPVIAPTFDVPLFGATIALGDFILGDDCRIVIDPDERFPAGLDTYLRIVGVNAQPADAGESIMTITVGIPPALAPVPAPPS
jgi:hypothetical protein